MSLRHFYRSTRTLVEGGLGDHEVLHPRQWLQRFGTKRQEELRLGWWRASSRRARRRSLSFSPHLSRLEL